METVETAMGNSGGNSRNSGGKQRWKQWKQRWETAVETVETTVGNSGGNSGNSGGAWPASVGWPDQMELFDGSRHPKPHLPPDVQLQLLRKRAEGKRSRAQAGRRAVSQDLERQWAATADAARTRRAVFAQRLHVLPAYEAELAVRDGPAGPRPPLLTLGLREDRELAEERSG